MGTCADQRRLRALVLGVLAIAVSAAAGCTAAPSGADPGLRAELDAVAPADLRGRDNPTQDPQVVNRLWGDALFRRATPLTSRPSRGPGAPPVRQARPLLVTDARPPQAGLPGASGVAAVDDPRFAQAAVGRLFFTMDAVPRTCTAQVVSSDTRAVLATAGHCLFSSGDGGRRSWAQNVMFVPGYRDGTSPAGRWFADPRPGAVVVTAGWQGRQDWSEDVGFVRLLSRGAVRVQDVAGGLGVAFGGTSSSGVEVLGYPAAGRFDGARLQSCRSGGPDPLDQPALGVVCAMTAGYSGGPWLARQNPGTVVAVSSHDYAAGTVYGAWLGPAALEAYRRADSPR